MIEPSIYLETDPGSIADALSRFKAHPGTEVSIGSTGTITAVGTFDDIPAQYVLNDGQMHLTIWDKEHGNFIAHDTNGKALTLNEETV